MANGDACVPKALQRHIGPKQDEDKFVEVKVAVVADTQYGERLFLLGAGAELGEWQVEKGIELATSAGAFPVWTTTVRFPCTADVPAHCKFVVLRADRNICWEEVPNRELVIAHGSCLVAYFGKAAGALTMSPPMAIPRFGPEGVLLIEAVCVDTRPGDTFCAVGASQELGVWDPHKGLRLVTCGNSFPTWYAAVRMGFNGDAVNWKFAILRADDSVDWEKGPLRTVESPINTDSSSWGATLCRTEFRGVDIDGASVPIAQTFLQQPPSPVHEESPPRQQMRREMTLASIDAPTLDGATTPRLQVSPRIKHAQTLANIDETIPGEEATPKSQDPLMDEIRRAPTISAFSDFPEISEVRSEENVTEHTPKSDPHSPSSMKGDIKGKRERVGTSADDAETTCDDQCSDWPGSPESSTNLKSNDFVKEKTAAVTTNVTFRAAGHKVAKTPGQCEDAYFIGSRILGVADGVGACNQLEAHGVNAAVFAKEIMQISQTALVNEDPDASVQESVAAALAIAERDVSSLGASTALLAKIASNGEIGVANLGDSGFLLIRGQADEISGKPKLEIVCRSEEQQHDWNRPFQLMKMPEILAEYVIYHDKAEDAMKYQFQTVPGDLLLLYTDGFSDNMFDADVLKVIMKEIGGEGAFDSNFAIKTSGMLHPEFMVRALVKAAARASHDPLAKVPFCISSHKHGHKLVGGKIDDITVVAAWIVPENAADRF